MALLPSEWVTLGRFSDFWEHTGEYLEAEILFIPQAVGAALDHADLVVESFDEPQGDLVLWLAIRGDAVPMRAWFKKRAFQVTVRTIGDPALETGCRLLGGTTSRSYDRRKRV
jgi:hypothetical protein